MRKITQFLTCALLFASAAFSQCKNPPGGFPTLSQIADVSTQLGLSSDGNIRYTDQVDNTEVNTRIAANLHAYQPITKPFKKIRSLKIDLTRPLPGAANLGVIKDNQAEFHAHYKLDPTDPADGLRLIHSVSEIQVGQTIASERVVVVFSIAKTRYALLIGDAWPLNTCEPLNGAPIAGTGTIPATVTGTADGQWRVRSAPGSVARLFNITKIFQPVDRGLYYFDFDVTFSQKP